MSSSTKDLIDQAVRHIVEEVPALSRLKTVVRLELKARGEEQIWRVELPGPVVSRDPAGDARIDVSILRAPFNELAAEGQIKDWREAFERGVVKVTGQEQIVKLVGSVIERHEARTKLKKRRPPK